MARQSARPKARAMDYTILMFFPAIKTVEDSLLFTKLDRFSDIVHLQENIRRGAIGERDRNRGARRRILEGVFDQIAGDEGNLYEVRAN